jgi:hypothetical protein
MDPISSEYIRLSHAINRHVDGFIDAYFGPPELAVSGETVDPKTILSRVQQLRDQVRSWADEQRGDEQAQRRASYLDIQSHAMETVARKLCGQPVSFRDETRGCFDVDPQYTPDDQFEAAMSQLDQVLPGAGSVTSDCRPGRNGSRSPTTSAGR